MITAERLRKRLNYNPDTGIFMWLPRFDGPTWWNAKFSGKQAGHNHPGRPHRWIWIDGRSYFAARLAWLYMTGAWPIHLVDHRDGDGLNDSWQNLRTATSSENNANKKVNTNNRVGLKGVRQKGKRFEARITDRNGGLVRLGMFDTAEDAHAAYMKAAVDAFGEFARAA